MIKSLPQIITSRRRRGQSAIPPKKRKNRFKIHVFRAFSGAERVLWMSFLWYNTTDTGVVFENGVKELQTLLPRVESSDRNRTEIFVKTQGIAEENENS